MLKLDNSFINLLIKQNDSEGVQDKQYNNEYMACGLLVCLRFIPHTTQQQQMYYLTELIRKNFVFSTKQIHNLVGLIMEIGPFQLPSYDLQLQQVLDFLFENSNLMSDDSKFSILHHINDQEAIQRSLKLINLFTLKLMDEKVLFFDFSHHQNKKQIAVQESNVQSSINFPFVLNGIFERQIVLDLFPNEDSQLEKFPLKIPKKANDFIKLPPKFRINGYQQMNQPLEDDDDQEEQKLQKKIILPREDDQQNISKLDQQEGEEEKEEEEQQQYMSKQNEQKVSKEEERQNVSKEQQKAKYEEQNQDQNDDIIEKQQIHKKLEQEKQQQKDKQDNQQIEEKKQNAVYKENEDLNEWRPIELIQCVEYYESLEKVFDKKQYKFKNKVEQKSMKRTWNDIYDVTFKAAYFNKIINDQGDDELKRCCEFLIIKKYLDFRSIQEKKLIGSQSFIYTTMLILHFYGNQSFYMILIGAILTKIPGLLKDNGFSFVTGNLNMWEFELYIVFQMLMIFDNPNFFKSHYNYRNNFVFRFLNYFLKKEYNFDFNINNTINMMKQPNQEALELQRKLSENYFKLVNISKQKQLSIHLQIIQQLSNNKGILNIESYFQKIKKQIPQFKSNDNDEGQDQSWVDVLEQVKQMYIEAFPNKPNELLQNIIMPAIDDISSVDLKQKLNNKIQVMNQSYAVEQLQALRLYKTGRCPSFTLNFFPSMDIIKDIKYHIQNLVRELQQGKEFGKLQQEQFFLEKKKKFENMFGKDLGELFKKIEQCSELESEDFSISYYPILFFSFFETKLISEIKQ